MVFAYKALVCFHMDLTPFNNILFKGYETDQIFYFNYKVLLTKFNSQLGTLLEVFKSD